MMLEEFLVQQLLTAYTDTVNRRDWDQLKMQFVADAYWELAGSDIRFDGITAIRDGLTSLASQFSFIMQLNSPAVIIVDNDRATTRSGIREGGRFKDRDESINVFGMYDDHLVRTSAGWRFTSRIFRQIGEYRTALLPEAK
jgi:hypothetical protein